ncbi:MAG: inorganic triphosphatase [Hydrogenophilales bacterium 28-61-23]|nr:MAG: inorganic triphosphatase [Hydrogenophilales bacterium 28-61-23]
MEIELKLALPPRQAARFRGHPVLSGIKPARHALHSIYFDTPDFELMRRGIALRVRQVSFHWVQTMKTEGRALGALSHRSEWEMALAGGGNPDFAILPKAALDLLDGVDLNRIVPAFATRFQRTTWQIERDGNHAELALDSGEIQAGEARQKISEVELELKSGSAGFLFDLAAQLLARMPLHTEPRSKAQRGYALCGAITPAPVKAIRPEICPHQSAGEAWNAVMHAALAQMVANVPGALEEADNIEYLHQLRIGLRRLMVGVTLAKAFGQASPAWAPGLGETMRALNPARDWDVFLHDTLPKTRAALGGTLANSFANTPTQSSLEQTLLAQLRDVAASARLQAQAHLLAPAYTRLVLDIGRCLLAEHDDDANDAEDGALEATAWAAALLEKRWLTLRKRCRGFSKLGPTERHMARIAAKKMRYAADAFAPLYGKRGTRFIEALAALQNSLGRANDAHVGARLLDALPKKSAPLSFEFGRLAGALDVEAGRKAQLSGAIWRRLAQSRLFWR